MNILAVMHRAPLKIQSSDETTGTSTRRDKTCAEWLVTSKTRREQIFSWSAQPVFCAVQKILHRIGLSG